MKNKSLLNKRIEVPHEKEIKRVVIVMFLYYWLWYVYDITAKIKSLLATELVNIALELTIAFVFFLVYLKCCKREPAIDWNNKKQYKLVPILLVACLVNGLIQMYIDYGEIEVKFELIKEGKIGWILFYFVQFFFVVAVCEEFMNRVLIQNDLVAILGKYGFLAPLISAAYFGYIHTVQRTTEVAISAFAYGLIVGYAKYFNKNCTFVTLVLVHGLYDFLLTLL